MVDCCPGLGPTCLLQAQVTLQHLSAPARPASCCWIKKEKPGLKEGTESVVARLSTLAPSEHHRHHTKRQTLTASKPSSSRFSNALILAKRQIRILPIVCLRVRGLPSSHPTLGKSTELSNSFFSVFNNLPVPASQPAYLLSLPKVLATPLLRYSLVWVTLASPPVHPTWVLSIPLSFSPTSNPLHYHLRTLTTTHYLPYLNSMVSPETALTAMS